MNHPLPHDLTALAYGMVEAEERNKLLEHVHLCDDCRALYDSYLEEQALVRDSLFRDARSGPAEARALERTLHVLNGEPQPVLKDRWRIFHMVTWQFVGKAAAIIVVALGLMVILLRPDPDAPIQIASELQAQARVVSGSLMVPADGNWRPAADVPAQDWVMSSGAETLVLELPQGSQFTAEPGTVFRFVSGQGLELPSICVLHGTGEMRASEESFGVPLWSGEGEFLPLASCIVRYSAEFKGAETWRSNAYAVRAYERPSSVRLRLSSGRGVFLPTSNEEMPGVLDIGQSFYSSPQRADVAVDSTVYLWSRQGATDAKQWQLVLERRKETLALLNAAKQEAAANSRLTARLDHEARKLTTEQRILVELKVAADAGGIHGQAAQFLGHKRQFSPALVEALAQNGSCELRDDDNSVQLWITALGVARDSLFAEVNWPKYPAAAPQQYEAAGLEDLARRLPPDAGNLLYEPIRSVGTGAGGRLSPATPSRSQPGPMPQGR